MHGLYLFLLALLAADGTLAEGPSHGRRVVCYMASWGLYLEGAAKFDIPDTELAMPMCTHLVYLFATLDGGSLKINTTDPHRDITRGGISQSVKLKKKYPHLKVMICLGGWNDGSINYSTMVAKPDTRASFIKSVVEFLLEKKLDGIDISWQYPGERGGSSSDRVNFVALTKELRKALDEHSLILSIAVTSYPYRMDLGTDGGALAEHAHFLNILSYEYHAWWDKKVGPSTPLYAADNFCISDTIDRYLEMGASAHKLNLGLSSHGTTFILANPEDNTDVLGKNTTGHGFKGIHNSGEGYITYNEFCFESESGGWTETWDETSLTPFSVNSGRVVSFDNPRSFTEKIKFAMNKQLGGVIYYGLEKDDFRGNCKSSGGPYPCLRSIHNALLQYSALDFDKLNELLKLHNAHYFWNGMKS